MDKLDNVFFLKKDLDIFFVINDSFYSSYKLPKTLTNFRKYLTLFFSKKMHLKTFYKKNFYFKYVFQMLMLILYQVKLENKCFESANYYMQN